MSNCMLFLLTESQAEARGIAMPTGKVRGLLYPITFPLLPVP